MNNLDEQNKKTSVTRRGALTAAAWSVPAVVVAIAAPGAAASA